jgi:hypothetical protein
MTRKRLELVEGGNGWSIWPEDLLLRRNATRMVASQSGHLRVDFADGASIQVAPDDKYEAWRIVTESGGMAIARPDGAVDLSGFAAARQQRRMKEFLNARIFSTPVVRGVRQFHAGSRRPCPQIVEIQKDQTARRRTQTSG